ARLEFERRRDEEAFSPACILKRILRLVGGIHPHRRFISERHIDVSSQSVQAKTTGDKSKLSLELIFGCFGRDIDQTSIGDHRAAKQGAGRTLDHVNSLDICRIQRSVIDARETIDHGRLYGKSPHGVKLSTVTSTSCGLPKPGDSGGIF